ncbi:hypothetical protein [Microbacterium sp.]|uniref:hypothetical protein n=1 Tax=Microbacterium sp. TaxID=51671 RepID=UPI003A88CA96
MSRREPQSAAAPAISDDRSWARPAPTTVRLAAYSIDAVAVALVAMTVALITRSGTLTGIAVMEVVVILTLLEARTGITVGNLVLRLRTTRDDAPASLGAARGALRGLVQLGGSAVGLVGGWAVVATGAADPAGLSRSWADRVGRALVVTVPPSDADLGQHAPSVAPVED